MAETPKLPYGTVVTDMGWRLRVGDRIIAFDPRLFKDDRTTPLSFTKRPGRIVRIAVDKYNREIVEIKFDHREDISHGHFTAYLDLEDKS